MKTTLVGRSVFATGIVLMTVLALTLTLAMPVGATVIAPGASGAPSDDTGNSGFTLIATALDFDTAVPANFTASTTAAVILDNDDMRLGFFWQVTNSAGSTDAILRLTGVGFTGFITDFVFRTDDFGFLGTPFVAGTVAPTTGTLSLSGDTVGFYFPVPTGIPKGDTSQVMGVWTDALYSQAALSSLIDGGVMNFDSFGPAIPEPSTYILLGSALFGLGVYRRRGRIFSRRD